MEIQIGTALVEMILDVISGYLVKDMTEDEVGYDEHDVKMQKREEMVASEFSVRPDGQAKVPFA